MYVSTTTVLAQVFGAPFQVALAVGFAVGLCVHFTLQRVFVWVDRTEFVLAIHEQAGRYLLLAAAQYLLTAAATAALPPLLEVSPQAVYLVTVVIVTAANSSSLQPRLPPPGGRDVSAAMERAWLVAPSPGDLDAALTAFVARKLMTVTRHGDGVMEVKPWLDAGDRPGRNAGLAAHPGRDLVPPRGKGTRVQARIGPRGRPGWFADARSSGCTRRRCRAGP